MKHTYNHFAGTSIERLCALSDGAFSIAMTLLVLDLRAPAVEAIHSERDLARALTALLPRLRVYVMSFLTLGIFWVGQQTQLNHVARSNKALTWIHLFFLFAVSITPFSTTLLAQFFTWRVALLCYWANIFLLGAMLFLSWNCALHEGLVKEDMPRQVSTAIKKRIVIAQSLYAGGAALCVFDTYASVAAFVLVQMFYVFSAVPGRPGKE